MRRKTGLSQREIEILFKNPPIGFISIGGGFIFPCIFLGRVIPSDARLWLGLIGALFILVGIVWLICRTDYAGRGGCNSLDFEINKCENRTIHYINRLSKTNKKIVGNSDKIKALIELNNQYSFNSYKPTQKHYYSCKNKREFDRMSIREYFFNCVATNSYNYARLIECIKYNRVEYNSYLSKAEALKSTVTEELCTQLQIGFKKFKKREQKIFRKITHVIPQQTLDVYCEITYTSPKGRNHYRKNDSFVFRDLQETYGRVKKQQAEQQTREYKLKHERTKMSASLRYDILKRDCFKCKICGATEKDGIKLHVDHIVPVSKGGKTEWSNLRTLCERCNLGKSDKSEIQSFQAPIYDSVNDCEDLEIGDVICGAKKYSKQEWAYWEGAVKYFSRYSNSEDYTLIWELATNIWNDKDHEVYAYDLYRTIDQAIYYLYPFREREGARDMIIDLGYKGLSVVEGYKSVAKLNTVWRFPTKLAIQLEKSNRIAEAIELCDFCISHEITESNDSLFQARKYRLMKKLN